METLVLKYGVRDGQAMASTEVQQQNIALVQIREAILSSHDPQGAQMGMQTFSWKKLYSILIYFI